jgi:hypothetical protein
MWKSKSPDEDERHAYTDHDGCINLYIPTAKYSSRIFSKWQERREDVPLEPTRIK